MAGLRARIGGYPSENMELVLILIFGALVPVAALLAIVLLRRRERARQLRRDKLDGVAEGHREMAESHAGSLDELRSRALGHRQAAVDHTRNAEELEARIERQERHARFHEERAAATEEQREQV